MEFIPLLLIALLFWFLVIQPQRRRNRQQAAIWATLRPGEEVLTAGGLFGRVQRVDEGQVLLEVADNTIVRVDKRSISARVEQQPEPPDPG